MNINLGRAMTGRRSEANDLHRIILNASDPHSIPFLHRPRPRAIDPLLAKAGVILWQADIDRRRFTYIGPHAQCLFGYPLARWSERGFWERHLHPDDQAQVMTQIRNNPRKKNSHEIEYRVMAANGTSVWIRDTSVLVGKPGKVRRLHGVMLDGTAHKENERRLQDLSGRLINAQEAERSRIGRELHDDTSQRLALLAVRLELLQQSATGLSERWLAKIEEIHAEAKGISSDIHALCYRLHPSKLEQLGLVTALKRLCLELADQKRCDIPFRVHNVPVHLPTEISLCLYRVAQEALHNALKHSGAREIHVEMACDQDTIRLSLRDNGHGFVLAPKQGHEGLGLVSMRERLRLVHGALSIESSSQGVHITAKIPLQAVKTAGAEHV